MLDIQHDPWAVLELSSISLVAHDWSIGDAQDIVQYVKERYLESVRSKDDMAKPTSWSVRVADELL